MSRGVEGMQEDEKGWKVEEGFEAEGQEGGEWEEQEGGRGGGVRKDERKESGTVECQSTGARSMDLLSRRD